MKIIVDSLFGNLSSFKFENRVYNAIIFITIFQCVIGAVWNITLKMPFLYTVVIIACGIICSVFYYYSRFKRKFSALAFVFLSCILLSVVWFLNEGSQGATPFLFITASAGVICISPKKRHLLYIAIIVFTIGILLFLENNYYSLVMHGHHSEDARQSDIVFFFILDLLLIFFIVSFLKENYDKEAMVIQVQKETLSIQHNKIVSSIKSAEFIQEALLPNAKYLNTILSDYFVFYKPKDIVSGDFYWANFIENNSIIVAADCTGHGVSGALMSMLGIAFLNEIVAKNPHAQPSVYLNELREKVISTLNQPNAKSNVNYGMDISICCLNRDNETLQFAGANNSLFLIQNNQIIEYKADKMPIGLYPKEHPFTTQIIKVEPNDVCYICSDGFEDQFGTNKKKFLKHNFRNLLLDIHGKSMQDQKELIESRFYNWKGDED